MKNPLTTLGGIIGGIGTSLAGFGTLGIVSQFREGYEMSAGQVTAIWWVVLIGNILSVVGKSVAGAASADHATVERTVERTVEDKIMEKSGTVANPLERSKPPSA